MGLRNRSRQVHFGRSEAIAALLLCLSLASGAMWRMAGIAPHWREAPAHLVEVTPLSAPDTSTPTQLSLSFNYIANGKVYYGEKTLSRMQRVLLERIPGPAKRLIQQDSKLQLDHLPEPLRGVLESRGVHHFDAIPFSYYLALEKEGLTRISTMPDEVRRAIREEDYETLAGILDEVLPAGLASTQENPQPSATTRVISKTEERKEKKTLPVPQQAGVLDSLSFSAISTPTSNASNAPFRIRYNPQAPENYELVLFPHFSGAPFLLAFILFALLAFGYCAWAYPRIKALHL